MGLRRADVEDVYPLSPLQQGVLFHASLQPEAGDYIVQLSAELAPGISPALFRTAWQTMIARHAVLRTLFVRDGPERPLQIVARHAELPWTELDWRNTTDDERQQRLQVMLAADRRRGFVLTEPPLLRIVALRIADDRWRVVVSFHHILWDGWSLGQLLQEVGWCCAALAEQRPPDLPARRPYRDYIAWLNRRDASVGEMFWRAELSGVEPVPLLIHRDARTSEQSSYAQLSLRFSPLEHAALVDFTRRSRITLNTAIQGAWAILLSRYTGSRDIVFGATVSGRPADLAGADAMFGLFLNTIPVRVAVNENARPEEWLRALQRRQARAREYGFCQLAQIQHAASPSSPLFDTILDVKSFPLLRQPGHVDLPLFAGRVDTFEQSGYALTLTASYQPHLVIDADYDETRFSAATVSRLLAHLQQLLGRMGARPTGAVADLDPLSTPDRQALLAWSHGPKAERRRVEFPRDFEMHAAAAPDRPAVVADDECLDYCTLNRRANQLASELTALGIGPERRVGVCMHRSAALVTAVVAIVKAGGVYVPLDPTQPRERLQRCAAVAPVDALIVTADTVAIAPADVAAVVDLDRDWERITTRPADAPTRAVDSRNLAYISFTSGSTGVPKAATVDIRGMRNHLDAMIDTLALAPSDVLAQTAPIGFDISVWQMLAPLAAGAAVRVFPDDVAFDAAGLADGIERDHVTIVQVVPASLRLLLDHADAAGTRVADELRWLVVTGDAVPADLAARWLTAYPDVPLVNAYGPAECADDVTLDVVADEAMAGSRGVPIGRPISEVEVYVLDRRMRLVPPGVAGEICIGGVAVGRGYFADPARTASAFVPHPFAERPGERLYRTGDLGWWREDGRLAFLGRADAQIKVNGARVEASEVESAIAEYDEVREAAVQVIGQGAARRLAAFIVATDPNAGVDVAERVKGHLRGRLPRFMVPSIVTVVARMPLTPNGKLDRRRLEQQAATSAATPRQRGELTPAEQAIAAIWTHVLGLDEVNRDDDFFELGGHSLLAMQIVSKASRLFDCAIPLEALFTSSRLDAFTRRVESMRTGAAHGRPSIDPAPRGRPLPVSSSQLRMWQLIVSWPQYALYTMPMALRLEGRLDASALASALADVVARHETLRTRVRTLDGALVQCVDDPLPLFELPFVDLAHYGDDVEALARQVIGEEAARGFNPIDEHGVRAALLKLAAEQHVLLLTVHHLIADDASIGVLLRDLAQAYQARSAGLPSPLAPLRLQFADYVCWAERWLASEDGQRHEAYWHRQLGPPWTPVELPTSRPRAAAAGHRFRRVRRRLDARVTRRLREFARSQGKSLFAVVLAAYKLFLCRASGATDIAVATMVSTRDGADFREVIGPLLTTQLLRTDLAGVVRFDDVLARVQRTVVDALARRDVPIDRALAAAGSPDDARPPVATLLLFQQISDEAWTMGDVRVSPFATNDNGGGDDELEFTSYETICEIEVRRDAIDVVLRYDAGLFDDELADRLIDTFGDLLASCTGEGRESSSSRELSRERV